MINAFLRILVKMLLRLRYRIRVTGLDEVARRGRTGIAFLPNHPALIDPIIMMATLMKDFAPRALADRKQIDRFFIRNLARRVGVRAIPDMAGDSSLDSRRQIQAMLQESIEGLGRGENLLMYPAGRIYRQWLEDLGASSAAETILQELPEVRMVLVRTCGLWGSGFSWASGKSPEVGRLILKALWAIPASFVFFVPKREVTIEFVEPGDLPRRTSRDVLNRYMERFYNQDAPHRTYVPFTLWEGLRKGFGSIVQPEPTGSATDGKALTPQGSVQVPPATRALVAEHLAEVSGKSEVRDEDVLARDLGLDSLARAELATWIEAQFGFAVPGVESMETALDVMLAACGEASAGGHATISPPPRRWFDVPQGKAAVTRAKTIAEAFLLQARANPSSPVAADATSGFKTYRDIMTAVLALQPVLRQMPGECLGIMLPASVAADVAYLSVLFAGKTPVMINWTAGQRNVAYALEILDVRRVLTSRRMVGVLKAQGNDLSALADRLMAMEDIPAKLNGMFGGSIRWKLRAALAARLRRNMLDSVKVSATAAILFTSGSESLPKAVPLTHANILANVADVLRVVEIRRDDCLLGMLPPFHSFGLTVGTILPMVLGVRVCHYPNPTDGPALAAMIEAYKVTLTVGTPTFMGGIARAAGLGQLASLRLAVTGAEKCSSRIYDQLERACPQATILEGYGLTECSPIVSVNKPDHAVRETIGKVLPSLQYAIVNEDTDRRVARGQQGILLVAGPSVFGGYLKHTGPSPFVEFEARQWYRTGDLVREDEDGVLTFLGRLKRFVKLGGEMVSLPAIEAVLEEKFVSAETVEPVASDTPPGPSLAVEATASEHPEIVLVTMLGVTRQQANEAIQAAGLSPLHNIRRVLKVKAIPVLGTGKTDYRAVKAML